MMEEDADFRIGDLPLVTYIISKIYDASQFTLFI